MQMHQAGAPCQGNCETAQAWILDEICQVLVQPRPWSNCTYGYLTECMYDTYCITGSDPVLVPNHNKS